MFADDSNISDLMFDPGPKHSTPVKDPGISKTQHGSTNASNTLAVQLHPQLTEESLIAQQRKEIALLMAELRDRDRELNDLVLSHQHQLGIWEQDRQLILSLQQKCHCLTEELKQQKAAASKPPNRKHDSSESVIETDVHHQSSSSHQSSEQLQQLQNHNENLNDSLKEVCTAKGHLEAKEQELITLLKLKEDSLAEAQQTIEDLRAKVKSIEIQQREEQEVELQQMVNHWQKTCQKLTEEKNKLVKACKEKDRQLQQATTQLQDTVQQALVLQQALAISCDREKNKDELLASVNARQERLNLELNQLRKLCRRQNREKTLLQLTLDTSKESDVEPSDSEKQGVCSMAMSGGQQNISSSCFHSLPFNISHYQCGAEARQDLDPSKSITIPMNSDNKCKRSGNKANNGSIYSNTEHNTQDNGSTASQHSENNSRYVTGDGFDRANTKTHMNTNNNSTYSAQSQNLAQVTSVSHDVSDHNRNPDAVAHSLDSDADDARRVPDVDTEAFWQKILSVRHGNHSNLQETKKLSSSPIKHWLADVQREAEKSGLSRLDNDSAPDFTEISPVVTPAGSSEAHNAKSQRLQQHLLLNSFPPHSSASNFVVTKIPQNASLSTKGPESHEDHTPHDSSHPLGSHGLGSVQKYSSTPTFSRHAGFDYHVENQHRLQADSTKSEPVHLPAEKIVDDHYQHAVLQSSHEQANADPAFPVSTLFDDKLSSFLETPENDVSFDSTGCQGPGSPTSRLHHLLIESQEMLKGLEATALCGNH